VGGRGSISVGVGSEAVPVRRAGMYVAAGKEWKGQGEGRIGGGRRFLFFPFCSFLFVADLFLYIWTPLGILVSGWLLGQEWIWVPTVTRIGLIV